MSCGPVVTKRATAAKRRKSATSRHVSAKAAAAAHAKACTVKKRGTTSVPPQVTAAVAIGTVLAQKAQRAVKAQKA
jgi:hypothetical protein